MNNHNSSINSTLNENGRVIIAPQTLPPQNFPSFETEEDDIDLKDFFSVIKRRALVIISVVSVVMSTVIYLTLKAENIYEGNFQLLVEPVNSDSNLLGQVPLPESSVMNNSALDYESQIEVLISQELMKEVLPKIQSSYPDLTYDLLMENLKISRLGKTKIIKISYRHQEPQKIDLVLKTLSDFYLKYSLDKRKTKLTQGVQFVDKQLPAIRNRVAQLQKQLQIFRQRYDFIDPEHQSDHVAEQLQKLAEERLKIEQNLAAARATYVSLSTPEGQQATLNTAPIYSQLITQLRQLEAQLSGELVRFQPDSPSIKVLEEKRQNLLPLIEDEQRRYVGLKLAEATSVLQNLEVQSQELARVEQQTKQRFKQLPILARQYTEIQRNLQIANDSLNRFLEARENLVIQVAQTELPWELTQAANQKEDPVLPNIPRNLLLGLFGSLAAGVGIAFLLEKLDNTFHDVDSLKEKIKLPLLGTLPIDKSIKDYQSAYNNRSTSKSESGKFPQVDSWLSKLFYQRSKKSYYGYYGQGLFWESLQVLYSNIQLLNSDQPIRSLTISSTMPGDGKTTVAFHLAQTAAALGKRVLLVDGDLRRPKLHSISGLKNLFGLTNVLTSNIPVEQVIQQLPDMSLLSVITAGDKPPDPVRLLSSDKMKQVMEYLHENFDLVIYDAPPMLKIVDARLIAPQTDGTLLVVRMDKTDKSAVMQLQDSLKHFPINVLGVVANGENNQLHNYYSDYYYNTGIEARKS